MLHALSIRSDRFSYDVVNLDVEPGEARRYGVNRHGQVAFVNPTPAGGGEAAFEIVLGAIHIPGDPNHRTGRPVFSPIRNVIPRPAR